MRLQGQPAFLVPHHRLRLRKVVIEAVLVVPGVRRTKSGDDAGLNAMLLGHQVLMLVASVDLVDERIAEHFPVVGGKLERKVLELADVTVPEPEPYDPPPVSLAR